MSDLLVIAYDDEASAFEVRAELIRMQQEYLLQLEDAVVVTRPEGKVMLHQAVNLTATGALGGGMWGTLVGLIFLNPLVGAAVGAASGALAGRLTDVGINDDFIRDVGQSVAPGGSAVFLLIRRMTTDRVLQRLESLGKRGRILRTSLSEADEARLREAVSSDSGRQPSGVGGTAAAAGGGSAGAGPTSEVEAPASAMTAPAGDASAPEGATSEADAPASAMTARIVTPSERAEPTSETEAPASAMTAGTDRPESPDGPTSETEAPPSSAMPQR